MLQTRTTYVLLTLCLLLAAGANDALAQGTPSVLKREFRGAWIATVTNLDWPDSRGQSTAAQQASLRLQFDSLKQAGINAVVFQIRTEGDAFYASPYEPWSYWLTGQQGQAPNPFWDPLAFAIEEAHKRGMELHAWFNPYRMERSVGNYTRHPSHITLQKPEWALTIGTYRMLDPGLQAVRDYTTKILMDVVRRYDVDGIHMDDYFYPYPPTTISNQDDATFAAEPRGFTNRADWRRDNNNLLMKQIYDSVQVIKPHVKFGMSPFGIWKNGVPSGITGMDAYSQIYADALAWIADGSVDYLVPQLYWAFGGGQDYGKLAPWWASQMNGRHLYPGLAVYKSDSRSFSGALFGAGEIPRQVRFNQNHAGIQGSVHFRMRNITHWNSAGVTDSLRTRLYRHRALPPAMSWKGVVPPTSATGLQMSVSSTDHLVFTWSAPVTPEPAPRWYVLYAVPGSGPVLPSDLEDARHIVAMVRSTARTFTCHGRTGVAVPAGSRSCVTTSGPHTFVVTALGGGGAVSLNSNGVTADIDGEELPVELTGFEAVQDGAASVLLRWTTASETNNAGFGIEARSRDSGWNAKAFVAGAGTSSSPTSYEHRLEALVPGHWSFRLRQVDFDGSVQYGPAVELDLELAAPFRLSELYPNPGRGRVQVSLSVREQQRVRAEVFDALGRRVSTLHEGVLAEGAAHELMLDTSRLTPGLYLLRVSGERFSASRVLTVTP